MLPPLSSLGSRRSAAPFLVALLSAPAWAGDGEPPAPVVVVIVHKENKVADPSLKELRALLLLERQFWPDGSRVVLLRRPTTSAEEKTLLGELYSMNEDKLRKYWTSRLFRGEIPALPAIVRTGQAAVAAVSKDKQAISIVLSSDVGDGVRTLSIDGKRPGDKGYPLAVKEAK